MSNEKLYIKGDKGHVYDVDGNLVVRPFDSFEQPKNIDLAETVVACRKIDGFMAAVTYTDEYGTLVSTTKSLESPYVDKAREMLGDYTGMDGFTVLFEIVHPDDPHIIPERAGAYMLAARNVKDGSLVSQQFLDFKAQEHKFYRPNWWLGPLWTVVQDAKRCQHEGYVVYGKTKALTIKSCYYLKRKQGNGTV